MNRIFLLICFMGTAFLKAQQPSHYWTFDGSDMLTDEAGKKAINIKSYNVKINTVKSIAGRGIEAASPGELIVTSLLKPASNLADFTLELAFKGKGFTFTTFPRADFRLSFSPGGTNIRYTVKRKGKATSENWVIPLTGTGVASYNNLVNAQWHHFVLIMRKSGNFEIWIDGKTDPRFTRNVPSFDSWVITGNDGLRLDAAIDELAFYREAISQDLIQQHVHELGKGQHYSFRVNPAVVAQRKKLPQQETYIMDEKEFAPGYPDYTVQATDQLKQFPLPRYAPDVQMPRNFPWMDITYLHRELSGDGGKGFGKVNPQTAVKLTDELVSNWNYYIELPTLRVDAATAQKRYTSPSEIFSSLINYANAHPQIPAATVLMQVQNKPVQAGFDRASPFVTAQNLADKYYLRGKNGKPIQYNNKKWLSPFTSMELVRKDGLTSVFYVNQLAKHLTRKIEMINENGEWFGHKWPQQFLQQSPEVTACLKKSGMDYERFNGWMHNRFDSVYKTTILEKIPWKDVRFTFYNVSAYNSAYWPEYSERIGTNTLFNGTPRSTPAFYPARPDNWRLASGPLNGYGTVAEGRKKEMALGVKFFAPFISAGWDLEEKNIRPAQWLGLLKSMVMLGADFFHVGYFNVTGKTGWPNGKGPNDPRGYIYQAAMPAYAQAIASQTWEFLDKGILLEDPLAKKQRMPYAFEALADNHLVLVRKLDKKYLIYGTVQPSSNYKGNAALEETTAITLEGKKISFNIRRQGSMYVLDLSGTQPVFYQLDGWHQYEHPWYWTNNFLVEAESTHDNVQKFTEGTNLEYANFVSFIRLEGNHTVSYDAQSRKEKDGWRSLLIRCRKKGGNPVLHIQYGGFRKEINIPKDQWDEIKIDIGEFSPTKDKNWNIHVSDGVADIDYLEWRLK